MADRWEPAAHIIQTAVESRIVPAAVAEVGNGDRLLWRARFGTLGVDADAAPTDVSGVFDLASLTKPLVTTLLALALDRAGRLSFDDRIQDSFPDWRGRDREHVTVQDLLEHTGGLAPRLVDAAPVSRREFEHDIASQPLEYEPRTQSLYTDLGFILLGFLLHDRGGPPLDQQFADARDRVWAEQTVEPDAFLDFQVSRAHRDRTAPTLPLDEDRRRGEILVGEVHDNYAAALGGVAGHAGLFGNASGVGAMARTWLRGARGLNDERSLLPTVAVARALRKSAVRGSSRALGWDTMLPTSSCGPDLSPRAFGHTGFTGVSLWIDPDRDRYFVLLTNRVFGGGTQDQMQAVRRAFHSAAAAAG